MLAVRCHRPQAGLSLTELLVAVAVGGIMLTIAAPSMQSLVRQMQLKTAVGDMAGAIDLTRAQAIMRGRRVYMAPTGSDWAGGWAVFIDTDGDARPGAADEIINTHGPLAGGVAISSGFTSPRAPDYIAYNAGGRSCSHASSMAARWGTLSLSLDGKLRRIKINMLGRSRTCDPERDAANCAGPDPP